MDDLLWRLRGWLSGLAAGILLALGAVAAPSLFALLERAQAGLVAGRLFQIEAHVSLGLAVLLVLIERRLAAARAAEGRGSRFSLELGLMLGVVFCTVAGYFALQPMMAQARAGQGPYSFGQLHAVSSAFFGLKGLLWMVLAWRCTRPRPW
ncbi:DUF4149 domain-containing protein [Schlegelella aquatica]|uniref:DUF4149 domain-containing protein n=1 Tax=Caldimonas aquatica TaxID=376175 RepID=UPI0037531CA5